jgi:hypothetical protein
MPRSGDKVIWITEYENSDTIEVCEAIIRRVKDGTCKGMIYALDEGAGPNGVEEHGVGATGSYRRNPVQGRAIAGALFDYFAQLARQFKRPGKL